MTVSRGHIETPRIDDLTSNLFALQGPCIGCSGCSGVCDALIDALIVPDLVLSKAVEKQ